MAGCRVHPFDVTPEWPVQLSNLFLYLCKNRTERVPDARVRDVAFLGFCMNTFDSIRDFKLECITIIWRRTVQLGP